MSPDEVIAFLARSKCNRPPSAIILPPCEHCAYIERAIVCVTALQDALRFAGERVDAAYRAKDAAQLELAIGPALPRKRPTGAWESEL